MEQARFGLIRDGKLSAAGELGRRSVSPPWQSPDDFDVVGNLSLLPTFCERDPETFFSLFEHVAV